MESCELEKRYEGLADSLPLALFELDSCGNILLINKGTKGFLGWGEDELRGKKFAEKVARRQLYELLKLFKDALSLGEETASIKLASADRGYIPVNLEVRAIKTTEGVSGFQCLAQEATDGLRFGTAKLITDLTYELTTTLTISKGAIELALNRRHDKLLEVARNALVRQNHLIRNLLDVIALDRMESEILLKKVDLKDLIHSSTRELKPISRRKGVKVELAFEGDLPTVTAAPEKIKNLLNTLLDSTLRRSQKGDTVIITAMREGKYLRICITGSRPMRVERDPEFAVIKGVIGAHKGMLRLDDKEICFLLPKG
jgi:PAS domain S-box-containing protein